MLRRLAVSVIFVLLSACTAGSGLFVGATPTPAPLVTPTPSPTVAPGSVALSATTLAFYAVGSTAAQNVTASQANYSGAFTAATANCAPVATISPSSGTTFTITPVAAGACSFSITGGNGQSATLTISVTTTTLSGASR